MNERQNTQRRDITDFLSSLNLKKIFKVISLNFCIVCINIVAFSRGFLGLPLNFQNVLKSSIGYTIIIMSIIVFCYGNYIMIIKTVPILIDNRTVSIKDYIDIAEELKDKRSFLEDINITIKQLQRYQKKKNSLNQELSQKFGESELTFSKFKGTIEAVEKVFFFNTKSLLNKINSFDEEEYSDCSGTDELAEEKRNICNEYISYVKDSIKRNEEILLKLDKLLLELSKFDNLDNTNVLELSELKELENLIKETKLYK